MEYLWTQISVYGYVRCSKKGHNSRTACVGSHICMACTSTIYRDHVYQVVLLFSSQPNETCHTWSLWRVDVHYILFEVKPRGFRAIFPFWNFFYTSIESYCLKLLLWFSKLFKWLFLLFLISCYTVVIGVYPSLSLKALLSDF